LMRIIGGLPEAVHRVTTPLLLAHSITRILSAVAMSRLRNAGSTAVPIGFAFAPRPGKADGLAMMRGNEHGIGLRLPAGEHLAYLRRRHGFLRSAGTGIRLARVDSGIQYTPPPFSRVLEEHGDDRPKASYLVPWDGAAARTDP